MTKFLSKKIQKKCIFFQKYHLSVVIFALFYHRNSPSRSRHLDISRSRQISFYKKCTENFEKISSNFSLFSCKFLLGTFGTIDTFYPQSAKVSIVPSHFFPIFTSYPIYAIVLYTMYIIPNQRDTRKTLDISYILLRHCLVITLTSTYPHTNHHETILDFTPGVHPTLTRRLPDVYPTITKTILQKKCSKTCVIQKKVVILHRI